MSAVTESTGRASSDGLSLHYRAFSGAQVGTEGGGKLPVLIVHGLSFFSWDWIPVARNLAADGRNVVAMDMRGFGDSDWSPGKDYSIPSNARDFIAVTDHLGWDKAVLLGHSMGGRHCTWCASVNPARIAALVSVDFAPAVNPEGSARVAKRTGSLPDSFASLDECIAWFEKDAGKTFNEAQRRRWAEFTRPAPGGGVMIKRDLHFRDGFRRILETGQRPPAEVDMWAALSAVQCPSLFVRGRRSDMFAAETVDKVLAANPRARVVELDTGHDVGGQDPDGLVREVQGFLASL